VRKHKKDMDATYSDNDKNWNHGSYKNDVVGIAKQIGRIKTYTQSFGYDQTESHMKYFLLLEEVEVNGEAREELKVMVDCCDKERQKAIPDVGSKVHFKTTRVNEWANVSESAPFEFWGDTFERKDDRKWISEYNLQVLEVREKSVVVGWVLPVNADDKLPDFLEYANKYRNEADIPIFHWCGEGGNGYGQLWCGTTYTTGNYIHETNVKEQVNCKRCLQKLGMKEELTDVLLMNTYFPKGHVRLKGDESCAIVDYTKKGKALEVADWIWQAKLDEQAWFVEVKRIRTEHVDKVLDIYSPKGWDR